MLADSIRLLNFDNSAAGQQELIRKYHPEIIDLTDLAPKARLWMGEKVKQELLARVKNPASGQVTFLGSGDFHHISQLLIEPIEEPVTLIVFDLHPDWDILPPRLGCGSWITQVLKKKNIRKAVLIGVSSDDISSRRIQSGNLACLKDNQVEIYPYSHPPTDVFLRSVPENISLRLEKKLLRTRIYWSQLRAVNLSQFIFSLLERLPVKKAYISIDKDCLKKEFAITNWEEGVFSLDELLLMLKILKENLDIVGMDITGDYSPVAISGRWKGFCSRLDHPKKPAGDELPMEAARAVNQQTNLKILEELFRK